jgi:hypothetical protein
MTTRREFLKAAAPAALTVAMPIIASAEPVKGDVQSAADSLCHAMAMNFGGEWRLSIEHDFVLISRLYR